MAKKKKAPTSIYQIDGVGITTGETVVDRIQARSQAQALVEFMERHDDTQMHTIVRIDEPNDSMQ